MKTLMSFFIATDWMEKPMLTRTCNICGRAHKVGETCPRAKQRHKEYDEFRRDEAATGFYKSRAWLKLATAIKERDHGLDKYELAINKKIVKGEMAAVYVDGGATLKRVYKNDKGVLLISENPKYQPMYFTAENCDEFRVLSKAVKKLTDIE